MLRSAFTQLGPPNIFYTFSFADFQNPTLQKNLLGDTDGGPARKLNKNSFTVSEFFKRQMVTIVENYFKKIPNYVWNFYRLEFQNRGSVHAHGFVRIQLTGKTQVEDYGA